MNKRIVNITLLSAGMALLSQSASAWHAHSKAKESKEIPYSESEIFFELNNTDGDLGIHALIDGEPWKTLKIEDPNERSMLNVRLNGRLRRQGLTEIFFESAEPTFDELTPATFFQRFPEGIYEIEGRTLDWQELESETELSHVMPAPPQASVNGQHMPVVCDEDDSDFDIVSVTAPVTIAWAAVTHSHPDAEGGGAGVQPPVPVTIANYQLVAEVELDVDGEEFSAVFSTVVPRTVTSLTLPDEFVALGDTFKFEVLAREQSYNQTAVESCFELSDE